MIYLGNAFSLGMLAGSVDLRVEQISISDIPREGFVSGVGHADTAALFSTLLGVNVQMNRVSLEMQAEDILYIGQYNGPRLPEGATSLPEGATIRWYRVSQTHYCYSEHTVS